MKAYRVPNAPAGERWQRTQAEAQAIARQHGATWLGVDIPNDQRGLIAWLNERTASAVARGATLVEHQEPAAIVRPEPPEPRAIGRITDEAFEALPLAYQLHLAALALENARSRLRPA